MQYRLSEKRKADRVSGQKGLNPKTKLSGKISGKRKENK